MSNEEGIKHIIQESIDTKVRVLSDAKLLSNIQHCISSICDAFKKGNRLWLCGNGGSAADAQHIAAELSGRFLIDRKALPAEALHVNSSYLTSVGNDYGFDQVYARMVEGVAQKGDVLLAISTSGNSTNIIQAVKSAKQKDVLTIVFTGQAGGLLKDMADILINIPSNSTPRIQEAHILVGHIICQEIEKEMFHA